MGASSWVAHDGNGTVGGAADNCERWRNGITFNGPDYPSTTYTTPVTVGHADRCGLTSATDNSVAREYCWNTACLSCLDLEISAQCSGREVMTNLMLFGRSQSIGAMWERISMTLLYAFSSSSRASMRMMTTSHDLESSRMGSNRREVTCLCGAAGYPFFRAFLRTRAAVGKEASCSAIVGMILFGSIVSGMFREIKN